MNRSISISRKIALAYSEVCKPLCKELGLPQNGLRHPDVPGEQPGL